MERTMVEGVFVHEAIQVLGQGTGDLQQLPENLSQKGFVPIRG
jgi:hypothetical protein